MTVTISLLGPPTAAIDGHPLQVDTRKAIALLAYLAVRGGPQGRDHLAGLLWPDNDQDRARAVLRRTLSALKSSLGDAVSADRNVVALDLTSVDLDVAAFRAALRAAKDEVDLKRRVQFLRSAIELHRGDFLEGFSLRDADTFDQWHDDERNALRRELTESLDLLVDAAAESGQIDLAIDSAAHRLRLDPLSEATHRALMSLHTRAGDRSATIAQYRACVTLLERELGVEPADATTRLYEAVTPGAIEPDLEVLPVLTPASFSRTAGQTPLVGRDLYLQELGSAFAGATDQPTIVTIEGEAGIGKTRLIEELIERVGPDAPIARVHGHGSESSIAYGAITQLLKPILTPTRLETLPRNAVRDLARLFPDLTDEDPGPVDQGSAGRLFESIRIALEAGLDGSGTALLIVDDAHWLDSASVDVLAYALRRLSPGTCAVIAWRPEEVGNDKSLPRALSEATAGKEARHLVLDLLDRASVEQLVHAVRPDSNESEALTDRLMAETDGLPFFLAEYLSVAIDGAEWEVPASIRDLLRDKLARVSDIGMQILGTAAVIDRSFDFETVCRASGRSDLETVDAIEELSALALVRQVEPTGSLYEFSHDKLRAVVLDEMSAVRKRLLNRRIADALVELAGRSGPAAGAIADHYAVAGALDEAASFYIEAGDHARTVFAHRDALAHYEAALGVGVEDPGPVHEAIGDLNVLLGDYVAARLSYERAAAGMPKAASRLEGKLGEVGLRRGDLELARAHLERALEVAGEDRVEIMCDLAIVALRKGDLERAAALVSTAAREAEQGAAGLRSYIENVAGKIAASSSDRASALTHLERSLELAEDARDEASVISALNSLALLHRDAGDNERAISLATRALASCRKIGDRHHEAALENNLADLFNAAGDREKAMEHLKRATAIFADIGDEPEGPVPEVWKLVDW